MTCNLTTLLSAELLRKSSFRRRVHKRLDHLEDLEVDGKIIFEWILNMLRGTDWILMGQDRDKWLTCKTGHENSKTVRATKFFD
jgi:hypothetical protein